jgi:hypothetical protein
MNGDWLRRLDHGGSANTVSGDGACPLLRRFVAGQAFEPDLRHTSVRLKSLTYSTRFHCRAASGTTVAIRLIAFKNALAAASTLSVETPRPR